MVPDAAQLLADSDFAFVGSIVDKQPVGRGEFGGEAIFTFQVSGWAKGNLGETVAVRSADNGAACGYELALGQEAAIFVNKINGTLQGGLCATMDAASLDAVADLVEPTVSTEPPPGGEPPIVEVNSPAPIGTIGAASASAVAIAAAVAWWMRRRPTA